MKTVAVPTFENRTAEFELVDKVTDAVDAGFAKDNTLKIRDEKTADAVVWGTIVRVNDMPSTYNKDESVEEYKVSIAVHIIFEDLVKDEIIWEEDMTAFGLYPYTGGAGGDREKGMDEAADKLAELIVNKTVSGW